MALAQRPGPRFFAAFYRWSRHTHRPSPCSLSSHSGRLSRCPATLANARSYHATCRLKGDKQSTHDLMQVPESSVDAAQEDDPSPAKPREETGDPARLKEEVRRLMRKVPASVAVITVAHVDPTADESVPMGIAVSSLSSVTLDPPTISFNIKKPSQALDAIRHANGRFRVHWLNGNSSSREVIEHFCIGNHPEAYEQRRKKLKIDLPRSAYGSRNAALAPRIRGPSVRAAAECTMTHEFDVGDHVILVAQVTEIESNDHGDPTIAYVDGSYRSLGSADGVLGRHQDYQDSNQPAVQEQDAASPTRPYATGKDTKLKLNRAHELSIAYDWPGIPGEAERGEYVKRLASYIKKMQGGRNTPIRSVIASLQPETRQLASSLGIDMNALVAECLGTEARERQILPEFYGRLSSGKLAELGDRMTQFVKADRGFLDMRYTELLNRLAVAIGASTLLPSDLLDPLRAEGLLPPFEPSASLLKQNGIRGNVLVVEQVEHVIRNELSRLSDDKRFSSSLVPLLRRAGLSSSNSLLLWQSLTSLKVKTFKSFSEIWRHDIAGELTSEEAQVVMRRLVKHMGVESEQLYRTRMAQSPNSLLMGIGVHPLTTGLNIDFIIDKVRYLFSTTKDFPDLRNRVEEMLQPYFDSNVTWEDLKSRVEQFVQKLPLRATTWAKGDILAAMGLSSRTLISTPLTETPNTIDQSNLLDVLVANALKKKYGNGTEEENQAIATFLKERYDFDVTGQSFEVTPEEALQRSSADDMGAAMLQHRAETFPIRDVGT
ncbi:putative oxidoreductase [Stagonosporopsis vannaccii]|nr:putative oxidoreductase [Stagonosporopsis vannaccii]